MRKVVDYIIVGHKETRILTDEVMKYVWKGYEPIGALTVVPTRWSGSLTQVMVKYEDNNE